MKRSSASWVALAAGRTLPALLLATTTLAGARVLAAEAGVADASAGGATTLGEVVVTATKRSENLQKIPMSIQAIDTKKLSQLNITSFNDYVKFIPSLQANQGGPPNTNIIYMRGVSDGGNGNHSGPQPSVGTYLDELPVTTIGGTLDVHIYDIARIEVLPGPQGTLYGASSEAGTLRIITNKPSTAGFSGGLDVQGNWVDHGSEGYILDGFVNVPIGANAALRVTAFDEHDAGWIDNVYGTRFYPTPNTIINNAPYVKKNFNPVDTYGGRAALKIDLGPNWTITPQVIAQDTRSGGVFGYEPKSVCLKCSAFSRTVIMIAGSRPVSRSTVKSGVTILLMLADISIVRLTLSVITPIILFHMTRAAAMHLIGAPRSVRAGNVAERTAARYCQIRSRKSWGATGSKRAVTNFGSPRRPRTASALS